MSITIAYVIDSSNSDVPDWIVFSPVCTDQPTVCSLPWFLYLWIYPVVFSFIFLTWPIPESWLCLLHISTISLLCRFLWPCLRSATPQVLPWLFIADPFNNTSSCQRPPYLPTFFPALTQSPASGTQIHIWLGGFLSFKFFISNNLQDKNPNSEHVSTTPSVALNLSGSQTSVSFRGEWQNLCLLGSEHLLCHVWIFCSLASLRFSSARPLKSWSHLLQLQSIIVRYRTAI